ncbi:hypothetical protein CEE44_03500 [Candidatus Woesearchaeota archaeon B3_Woes]|nr:MAG: hypothetical protein CEE44_03500 [Candidatus Woesearchaeota archaeon B3_Woes]
MATAFGNVIEFLDKLGVYDVILPFLLVFTIVFAILEKTKVFGTEEVEGQTITKKNLNSMAAFTIAFLVVASSQLVEIVTKVSSQVVVLLLLSIFFLLLVGSFFKEGDPAFLEGGWKYLFMGIMFIGILGIFLHAIEREDGTPWLEWGWEQLTNNWSSTGVSSVVLIIVIIAFMFYIVEGGKPPKTVKKEIISEVKKE